MRRPIADTGDDADWRRQELRRPGISVVIPGTRARTRETRPDNGRHRGRWRVEGFCRLKDFRRSATRFDTLARNFASALVLGQCPRVPMPIESRPERPHRQLPRKTANARSWASKTSARPTRGSARTTSLRKPPVESAGGNLDDVSWEARSDADHSGSAGLVPHLITGKTASPSGASRRVAAFTTATDARQRALMRGERSTAGT
ncbi:hypothetical protein FF100_14865 [Methylobacterium terricola]|uniref:Transposase DDE domain-containing protein n=1 Tax=Methylobacterium terricola TaxID=2583531 RepID=A0A5C4LGM7_9HYPH|nr:hypothetical protein FF100_14865 [Methylobacterium terricola]